MPPPRTLSLLLAASVPLLTHAAPQSFDVPRDKLPPRSAWWTRRSEPLVEINVACKTIFIELRYATERNFTGQRIYPPRSRALVRRSVAERLQRVQDILRPQGFGLKIWDAYRPKWAHAKLWESTPNSEFVAAPATGGSFHTWGASVDVTLVDLRGMEQPMPTDFDDFTAAAQSEYQGSDPVVARNMKLLRSAMLAAGFCGIRDEWWHFTAEDAVLFAPVRLPLVAGGKY